MLGLPSGQAPCPRPEGQGAGEGLRVWRAGQLSPTLPPNKVMPGTEEETEAQHVAQEEGVGV